MRRGSTGAPPRSIPRTGWDSRRRRRTWGRPHSRADPPWSCPSAAWRPSELSDCPSRSDSWARCAFALAGRSQVLAWVPRRWVSGNG
eukprot:12584586-Alexandrium_andersonii.AAC.1